MSFYVKKNWPQLAEEATALLKTSFPSLSLGHTLLKLVRSLDTKRGGTSDAIARCWRQHTVRVALRRFRRRVKLRRVACL